VDHRLRPIRKAVDEVLRAMSSEFDKLYAEGGASIPPERLLGALLLQVFYSIRSERMLMEQLNITYWSAGSWAWKWMSRCGTMRCQYNGIR
jgi:transposase